MVARGICGTCGLLTMGVTRVGGTAYPGCRVTTARHAERMLVVVTEPLMT